MIVERVVFQTPIVKIGVLRCPPDDSTFKEPGPTHNLALVFPRSCVSVKRSDGVKFVSDPTMVAFWNRDQLYWREALSAEGARSDWFAIDHETVFDVVRS